MNALLKRISRYLHPEPPAVEPRVGEYRADYSPIAAEEIAQTDAECEELFRHSKELPRKA